VFSRHFSENRAFSAANFRIFRIIFSGKIGAGEGRGHSVYPTRRPQGAAQFAAGRIGSCPKRDIPLRTRNGRKRHGTLWAARPGPRRQGGCIPKPTDPAVPDIAPRTGPCSWWSGARGSNPTGRAVPRSAGAGSSRFRTRPRRPVGARRGNLVAPVRAALTGYGSSHSHLRLRRRPPLSPAGQRGRPHRITLPVRANSKARSPGLTPIPCPALRVDTARRRTSRAGSAFRASRLLRHAAPCLERKAARRRVPTGLAKVPTRQDHALPAPGLSEGETGRSRMRSLPTNWWRDIQPCSRAGIRQGPQSHPGNGSLECKPLPGFHRQRITEAGNETAAAAPVGTRGERVAGGGRPLFAARPERRWRKNSPKSGSRSSPAEAFRRRLELHFSPLESIRNAILHHRAEMPLQGLFMLISENSTRAVGPGFAPRIFKTRGPPPHGRARGRLAACAGALT
jgi:hypothetical protein